MEFHNQKGQLIGTLKAGVFRKVVNRDRHLMKMFDAWGIDYGVVTELHKQGCTEIRIKETKDNLVYTIPFADFFGKSQVQSFGEGQQAFCPRQLFTIVGKPEPALQIRNNKDQLIADIVERTTEPDKKQLAKRLAIAYNALGWSEIDLHALLKRADDKGVHNYTALVKWSCTIRGKQPE